MSSKNYDVNFSLNSIPTNGFGGHLPRRVSGVQPFGSIQSREVSLTISIDENGVGLLRDGESLGFIAMKINELFQCESWQ